MENQEEDFQFRFGYDVGFADRQEGKPDQSLLIPAMGVFENQDFAKGYKKGYSEGKFNLQAKPEVIDITPAGLLTQEGIKKVMDCHKEWDDSAHELANHVGFFFMAYASEIREDFRVTENTEGLVAIQELEVLIRKRSEAQGKFLRAIAGR